MDDRSEHKARFTAVLADLVCATHCHGCGGAGLISLCGYVGQYCEKSCWYYELEAGDEWECPFGNDCYECASVCERRIALTHSKHRSIHAHARVASTF